MLARLARRSFSLVELVVTCSVIAILCGCASIAATQALAVFSDDASDRAIEREAMEVVAWIKTHLHRARALRSDVKLFVTKERYTREISFEDFPGGKKDYYEPSNEFIAFRAPGAFFIYSYRHQTMTPSLRLSIHKKTNNGFKYAGLDIVVSGYGLVTLTKVR
jgi:hypothetical protein